MNVPEGYVNSREAKKYLHVASSALRQWANDGKIEYVRDKNGKRNSRYYYNIKLFLEKNGTAPVTSISQPTRRKICYCRVSTRLQHDDLTRQEQYLRVRYPDYEVIRDFGSGLNFKRKGIRTILEYAMRGEVEELVVAYRDRLCRFGFDLFKYFIEEISRGKIVVLNKVDSSPEQELVTDVLSVLHVFSARVNGLRKYKHQFIQEYEEQKKKDTGTDSKKEAGSTQPTRSSEKEGPQGNKKG